MIKKIFILLIMVLFVYGSVFAANKYELDKYHSSISFTVRHMVVSKVRGNFNDFDVTIMEDPADITKSSVTAVIKTASIDTGNEKRDNHLRSADFFDVEKFPEIVFKSQAVKKKGEAYELWGTLTMHGVTKNIIIPFEILGKMTDTGGTTHVGIESKLTLDRKDYGLTWNRTLDTGGVVVGTEVEIDILMELLNKKK
jgi:polyisoprenoid-binding protein YceI